MNKSKLWSDVLTSLEKDVAKNVFNNYLKNTKILDSTDDNLVLEVSSKFHQDYIKNNLLSNIKSVINTIADKDLSILFNINNSPSDTGLKESQAKDEKRSGSADSNAISENNIA